MGSLVRDPGLAWRPAGLPAHWAADLNWGTGESSRRVESRVGEGMLLGDSTGLIWGSLRWDAGALSSAGESSVGSGECARERARRGESRRADPGMASVMVCNSSVVVHNRRVWVDPLSPVTPYVSP